MRNVPRRGVANVVENLDGSRSATLSGEGDLSQTNRRPFWRTLPALLELRSVTLYPSQNRGVLSGLMTSCVYCDHTPQLTSISVRTAPPPASSCQPILGTQRCQGPPSTDPSPTRDFASAFWKHAS